MDLGEFQDRLGLYIKTRLQKQNKTKNEQTKQKPKYCVWSGISYVYAMVHM